MGQAVTAVADISTQITKIDDISRAVAVSVEEEANETAAIARHVSESATIAQMVSDRIVQVATDSQATMTAARDVYEAADGVSESVRQLRTILVKAVRTSTEEANRRKAERYSVNMPGHIRVNSQRHLVTVHNLSKGGALLAGTPPLDNGAAGFLSLPGLAFELPFKVVSCANGTLSLSFHLPEYEQNSYQDYISRFIDVNKRHTA